MKYKNGPFFQVPRSLFKEHQGGAIINRMPLSAFKLYIWLLELEHRYTATKGNRKKNAPEDYFFRSDEDLAKDTGMSARSITSAKKYLSAMHLIHTWKMHWIDPETQKKSEKYVTAFRIKDL